MILGLPSDEFALLHVLLSLVGLAAGAVTVAGMLLHRRLYQTAALFLITTTLASASGLLLLSAHVTPAYCADVLSLAVLGPALLGIYVFNARGVWRPIAIAGAVTAFYLNASVALAQGVHKIAVLKALGPTPFAPPFVIAELLLLGVFVALGIASIMSFHLAPEEIQRGCGCAPSGRGHPSTGLGEDKHRAVH